MKKALKRALMILAIAVSMVSCTSLRIDTDIEEMNERIECATDSTSTGRKSNPNKGLIIIHIPPIDPKV